MIHEQSKSPGYYDLARLRWQCRRGMLELDTLLEEFLDRQFAVLTPEEQSQFVALLACSDTELQAWLLEGQPVNPVHFCHIVARIRSVRGKG